MMGAREHVRHLWNGDVPLSLVFWLYGVVLPATFGSALHAFGRLTAATVAPDGPGEVTFAVLTVYALLQFVYTLFVSAAVWRSASTYLDQNLSAARIWWASLAKLCVLCWLIAGLPMAFVLAVESLRMLVS